MHIPWVALVFVSNFKQQRILKKKMNERTSFSSEKWENKKKNTLPKNKEKDKASKRNCI